MLHQARASGKNGAPPPATPPRGGVSVRPHQPPLRFLPPRVKRRVPAPLPGRVRMGPRLDGPKVVARRDDDGIDPVHDALVVGGTSERVRVRECERLEDSLDDLLPGDVVRLVRVLREARPGPRTALIPEV